MPETKTRFFSLGAIFKGMAFTLKMMFSRPVTRKYPYEKRPAMPGFRGLHALVRDESSQKEKCIACGLCGAICPSQCITIHTQEGEGGSKALRRYDIDTLRCLFCALCVEACPIGAIALTEFYEYAGYKKEDFIMNKERLLQNWDKYMAGDKGKTYFERFWHPVANDFIAHEDQAVFKGARKENNK